MYEDAVSHISEPTDPRTSVDNRLEAEKAESARPDEPHFSDSGRDASLLPPKPITLPVEPSTIEVKHPLTPLDRVKSFTIKSSLKLRANEAADFSQEDRKRLDRLASILGRDWITLFRGRRMSAFVPCLVSVTDQSDPLKDLGTYICIKGLGTEREIRIFHLGVSQKAVRYHYAPLKICYDMSLVNFAAAEDSKMGNITDGSFDTRETLCGKILRTKREDGTECLTTIGGLININDEYYLMTSSDHKQGPLCSDLSDTTSDDDTSSVSSGDTLVDEDFDDDMECPIILEPRIDEETEDREMTSPTPPPKELKPGEQLSIDVPGILGEEENTHWRLIPAPDHLLPNFISIPAGIFGPSPVSGYISEHKSWEDIQGGSTVAINTSGSRIAAGTIAGHTSYLISNGKVQQVGTIQLQSGTNLQRGDSGSWVVDGSLKVLGSVLAISDGSVYVVPLTEQLGQITVAMALRTLRYRSFYQRLYQQDKFIPGTARVSSPFYILLRRAYNVFRLNPAAAREYASEALSSLELNPSADTLQLVLTHHYSGLSLVDRTAFLDGVCHYNLDAVMRNPGLIWDKQEFFRTTGRHRDTRPRSLNSPLNLSGGILREWIFSALRTLIAFVFLGFVGGLIEALLAVIFVAPLANKELEMPRKSKLPLEDIIALSVGAASLILAVLSVFLASRALWRTTAEAKGRQGQPVRSF